MCSEPSEINSEPTSLNDLPDEILLKILSHFGQRTYATPLRRFVNGGMFWQKMLCCGRNYLTSVIVLLITI